MRVTGCRRQRAPRPCRPGDGAHKAQCCAVPNAPDNRRSDAAARLAAPSTSRLNGAMYAKCSRDARRSAAELKPFLTRVGCTPSGRRLERTCRRRQRWSSLPGRRLSIGIRTDAGTPQPHKLDRQGRRSRLPYTWIVEGDIKGCFDNLSHHHLLTRLRSRAADKKVIGLIGQFLKSGVLAEDQFQGAAPSGGGFHTKWSEALRGHPPRGRGAFSSPLMMTGRFRTGLLISRLKD